MPGRAAVSVAWLGRQRYDDALALQRALQSRREAGGEDWLLLLEHEPVFTLGRRFPEPKWRDRGAAEASGIPVVTTERGGDITYHGPGQLVAYAIVDLRAAGIGASDLVAGLEEAAIRTLARYGIAAGRDDRNRGAWAGGRKIAQIGVSVRHGVSMHGLALNVATDASHFALIEACGLADVEATTMTEQLDGDAPSVEEAGRAFAEAFGEVFRRAMRWERFPKTGREHRPNE